MTVNWPLLKWWKMSKHRYNPRVDANQADIVAALRSIPGVSVKTGVDDILIGFKGFNYLIEIKNPETAVKKNGGLKADALRKSQVDMQDNWKGHFAVLWSLDQILAEIGITK